MKAKVKEWKNGAAELELEDGQKLNLPEASIHASHGEEELLLFAVSKSRAEEDSALAQAMVNELLR